MIYHLRPWLHYESKKGTIDLGVVESCVERLVPEHRTDFLQRNALTKHFRGR